MWWQMACLSVKSKACGKLCSVVPGHPFNIVYLGLCGTGRCLCLTPMCQDPLSGVLFLNKLLAVLLVGGTKSGTIYVTMLIMSLPRNRFLFKLIFHFTKNERNCMIKWWIDEEGGIHKIGTYRNILIKKKTSMFISQLFLFF